MPPCPSHENPDHKALAQLARDDPEAFEALRREMLDEMIGRAPAPIQRRLNGLQFRVDQVRRLAHTPLGAAVKISELMWKSFLLLNHELLSAPGRRASLQPNKSRVIEFPQRPLLG